LFEHRPRDGHFEEGGMNEHEELLAKALACLGEASKIEDPAVRSKVLELVYQSQQVAQAALLRDLNGIRSNPERPMEGGSLVPPAPPTNPKSRV
jgi:hypothetical protein